VTGKPITNCGNGGKKMNHDDKEAAKRLGLAAQTLRNWRFLGKGPAYFKLGRRIIYKEADLEAFENSHRIDPEGR
jgi:hypothetical protein